VRDFIPLSDAEEAVLCCLLLRGAQTIGEIRTRTGRMHEFDSLEAVAEVLAALAGREDAVVRELPRQAGRKDCRWIHLLAGEPALDCGSEQAAPIEPARARVAAADQRVQDLEGEVAALQTRLEALEQAFDVFRSQFD
jgi:uncharacterized protein YceH (UPF0502 family)